MKLAFALLLLPLASCSSSEDAGGKAPGDAGAGGRASAGGMATGTGGAAAGGGASTGGAATGAGGATAGGGASTGGAAAGAGGVGAGGDGAAACDGFAPGATTVEVFDPPEFAAGDDPSSDPSCTEIVNPERGFFRFVDLRSLGSLTSVRGAGHSLVYGKILLDDYVDRDLDQPVLDELDGAFDAVRAAGLGVLPRFYYADDGSAPDAPESRVHRHIEQLMPLLRAHSDVIVALYAGFIGAWGEWHTSSSQLTEPGPRRAILDALLAALPAERQVLVRRPSFKEDVHGGPLTEAAAFSDTPLARVGHHNDCFVSSDDDVGTYQRPGEREYVLADSDFVAFGGETCAVFPARSACGPAMAEMALMHTSFLNVDYHPDVIDGWQSDGCHAQIACRMGYRLLVTRRESPTTVRRGSTLGVLLRLVNDGYARPINARGVELVLDGPSLVRLPVPVDVRTWKPGAPIDLCLSAAVPVDIPAGDYSLGIALPAAAAAVKDDPRYAIRFSGGTTWDAATGVNVTGARVTVTE